MRKLPDKITKQHWTYYSKRHKGFLIDRNKERMRRHKSKESQIYCDWVVGKVGSSFNAIAMDLAARRTIHELQVRHNARVRTIRDFYKLLILHVHASRQPEAVFSRHSFIQFVDSMHIVEGKPVHGLTPRAIDRLIVILANEHYINPLGNALYSCTMRLKLVVRIFERHYKDIHSPITE